MRSSVRLGRGRMPVVGATSGSRRVGTGSHRLGLLSLHRPIHQPPQARPVPRLGETPSDRRAGAGRPRVVPVRMIALGRTPPLRFHGGQSRWFRPEPFDGPADRAPYAPARGSAGVCRPGSQGRRCAMTDDRAGTDVPAGVSSIRPRRPLCRGQASACPRRRPTRAPSYVNRWLLALRSCRTRKPVHGCWPTRCW